MLDTEKVGEITRKYQMQNNRKNFLSNNETGNA